MKSNKVGSLHTDRGGLKSKTKNSDGTGQYTENDDVTGDDVSGSQPGKRKKKLKMSKDLNNLLGELDKKGGSSSNKITFARGIQCDDLDPLNYLLEKANDLINMNIKYENVKAAMDV